MLTNLTARPTALTVSLFLGKRNDKTIKPKPLEVISRAKLLKTKFHTLCFFTVLYKINPPKTISKTMPIKNTQSATYFNSKILLDITGKYLGCVIVATTTIIKVITSVTINPQKVFLAIFLTRFKRSCLSFLAFTQITSLLIELLLA